MAEIDRDKPWLNVASEPRRASATRQFRRARGPVPPPRSMPPRPPGPVFNRRKVAIGAILFGIILIGSALSSFENVLAWILAFVLFAIIVLAIIEWFLRNAIKRWIYIWLGDQVARRWLLRRHR